MIETLRRYRDTHRTGGGGSEELPLEILRRWIGEHGVPGSPEATESLAASLGLPVATVRGVLSFYADLPARGGVRVCHGTSCELAGAAELERNLKSRFDCGPVYCLGYCDRSPAILLHGERVLFDRGARQLALGGRADGGEVEREGPPAIRCLAAEPLVTRRVIRGDFSSFAAARADGAYRVLERALEGPAADVLAAVEASGVRGRGGAGFPTGTKWRRCAETPAEIRYAVANGDEGDPGSFIDRVLLEQDPHGVLEGLALCAYAVGARQGIVFVRSEYPRALARIEAAVREAREAGFLGAGVAGSDFAFDVSLSVGMGSYVCGEETAMLNAIEGLRGEVRLRPPYPAEAGLYGKPTVVNNVETLLNVPRIVERGGEAFAALGTAGSSGTKALCLNHGFARPGILEVGFGVTLREVIEEAGGAGDGRRLAAVVLGGPMGSVLSPPEWDVPVCYQAMAERGIQLGHGGLVALPEGTDFWALLEHWLRFMAHESCGKCAPCRLGSWRALDLVRRGREHGVTGAELSWLFDTMEQGSLCAFGQNLPGPMRRLLELAEGRG